MDANQERLQEEAAQKAAAEEVELSRLEEDSALKAAPDAEQKRLEEEEEEEESGRDVSSQA